MSKQQLSESIDISKIRADIQNPAKVYSTVKPILETYRRKLYAGGILILLLFAGLKEWTTTTGSECTLIVAKDSALIISAQESGVLKQINVKDGDFVEIGAILAVCEDLESEKQFVRLRAEFESLQGESVKLQSQRMEQRASVAQARNSYQQYQREATEFNKEEIAIANSNTIADAYPAELLELQAQVDVKQIDEQTQLLETQRYETLFKQGLVSQSQLETVRNRYQIVVKERQAAENRFIAAKVSHNRKTNSINTQAKIAEKNVEAEQQKLATIDAEIKLINDQIVAKQNELLLLEKKNNLLIIKAPRAGMILAQEIEKKLGQFLERGNELCRLADISQLRAVAEVSEWDITQVNLGSSVHLRMRSLSNETFQGYVRHISSEAIINTQTQLRVYHCEINIDNRKNILRPGMSGFARVVLGKAPGYMLVWRWLRRTIRLDYWA
ncbi:MAG: efflux RND transporter periplasmic adaptor subunit [Acidobacteriota bacterium]